MPRAQRIALFGGAFDPPHLGHVLAASYAFSAANVDEIWILPVAKHPYGKPLSPWAQRWELCQAAFGKLGFAQVRDDELKNADGYTHTLVETLQEQRPNTEWFLIGGSDTSADMVNWYRGRELLQMVEVIAVPRRGFDDAKASALPAISSSLVRERLQRDQSVDDLVPAAVLQIIQKRGWYR